MQDRRILYVDASFNNESKKSKISLYDKEVNKLDTIILTKAKSSLEAEKYAILNAVLYVKKYAILDRKVHILNDNFNATQDEEILSICKKCNIGLSWIPREVNEIADKGTHLEVNIGEKESNILEFFYELITNTVTIIKEENISKGNIETNSKRENILINAVRHTKLENKPYVAIGQVGKYLIDNNPTFKYSSLKQELLAYDKTFVIVNNNFVKIK